MFKSFYLGVKWGRNRRGEGGCWTFTWIWFSKFKCFIMWFLYASILIFVDSQLLDCGSWTIFGPPRAVQILMKVYIYICHWIVDLLDCLDLLLIHPFFSLFYNQILLYVFKYTHLTMEIREFVCQQLIRTSGWIHLSQGDHYQTIVV